MTKGAKSSSVSKAIQDEELKTVVLISGLNDAYLKPVSNYLPECLLGIGSIPILHYQISYLIQENFQRIIIYALSSSKMIKKYCQAHYGNLKIEVQNGAKSKNIGDIMRDLDCNQSIRSLQDFVIMPIDLLMTTSLMDLFREHIERRERMASCVMTFGMVKSTRDLFLQSDQIRGIALKPTAENKMTAFDRYFIPKCHKDSRIESFIEDVGLVICTKHIPPLFQDNFDYANFEDLIHGILINEEIIQYTMHLSFLPPSSVHLRVACDLPRLLDSTRLILVRNLLPFHDIPPNYLPIQQQQSYHLYNGLPSVYVCKKAFIHPSVKFLGACMIGSGTRIGAEAILIDCVLGNNCSVGEKVRLRRVVAMDEVTICDRVRMEQALVFGNSQIMSRAKLDRNVVIGPSLVVDEVAAKKVESKSEYQRSSYYIQSPGMITIGPDARIPGNSVIVAPDERNPMADPEVVGKAAWASVYSLKNDPDSSDEDSDFGSDSDDEGPKVVQAYPDDRIKPWTTVFETSMKLGRTYLSKKMSCSKSEDDLGERRKSLSRQSITPLAPGPASADKAEEFLVEELRNTLERCLTEKIDPKNTTLEINSLKHAYAVLIEDLFFLLSQALLQTSLDKVAKAKKIDQANVEVKDFVKEFKGSVAYFGPMLDTYFKDANDAQEICMSAIEDLATSSPVVLKSGQYILHILYDADILSEDIILEWNESSDLLEDPDTAEKAMEFRKYTKPFVEWLEEASEDEEESSDEE